MPSNFQVVDSTFNIISTSSGPYLRFIIAQPMTATGGLVLTMSVKTGYSDITKSASVTMNGNQIGTIDPRPWVNHTEIDMEAVTFVAPASSLVVVPIFLGANIGINMLEIVLGSTDPDGYVFVENIVCQYHES